MNKAIKGNGDMALVTASDALVTHRLVEYAKDADGAFSENTLKAIKSDTAQFSAWCLTNDLAAFPAAATTLVRYIDEMAAVHKTATIIRRLSSIAHMHRAAGFSDPTKDDKVKLAKRRLKRSKGVRQKQAQGITEHDVSAILATVGNTLVDKRDVAMLLTARDILARRSELTVIRVEDIQYSEDGSATVLLERSKTDQDGEGSVVWLSPRAVTAIRNWLNAADLQTGYIFRSLRKGGKVCARLSNRGVNERFKAMAARAGIDARGVTSHSCRVGMAQDLAASGAELPELMTAGRWKSPQMPARYTERTTAARGAVAKYHERRREKE